MLLLNYLAFSFSSRKASGWKVKRLEIALWHLIFRLFSSRPRRCSPLPAGPLVFYTCLHVTIHIVSSSHMFLALIGNLERSLHGLCQIFVSAGQSFMWDRARETSGCLDAGWRDHRPVLMLDRHFIDLQGTQNLPVTSALLLKIM